ncbi:hypothetical protein [Flindersiella endophytica]
MIRLRHAGFLRFLYPMMFGMLGAVLLARGIAGLPVEGMTVSHIAEAVVGAPTLALAAFLWFRPRPPAPNLVVVEPPGLRWYDRGSSWAIAWTELAAVSIATSKTLGGYSTFPQSPYTVWVRIDLYPGDPGFQERHPDLTPFWEAAGGQQCYRIPLGQAESELRALDNGLRMYAPTHYRGTTDEGWSPNPFRDQ